MRLHILREARFAVGLIVFIEYVNQTIRKKQNPVAGFKLNGLRFVFPFLAHTDIHSGGMQFFNRFALRAPKVRSPMPGACVMK